MTITIPSTGRYDRNFRLHAFQEIGRRRVFGTMMRNFQNLSLNIHVLTQHAMLGLLLSISGQQHRKIAIVQTQYNRIRIRLIATSLHLLPVKEWLGWSEHSQKRAIA